MLKSLCGLAVAASMMVLAGHTTAQERKLAFKYEDLKVCLTTAPNAFVEGTDFVLATATRVDYFTMPALEAGRVCIAALMEKNGTAKKAPDKK